MSVTMSIDNAKRSHSVSGQSANRAWWMLQAGRALLLLLFLGVWQAAVHAGMADKAFVSSPVDIAKALARMLAEAEFYGHLGTTGMEVSIAFAASVLLGVAAAVFLDRNEMARNLLNPYIAAFNSMPRIALGPIFILWFGIGMSSKVVLALSLGFFIMLMSTMGGLRTVDRDMLLMSRLYGASNARLFWHVRLPWALPSVFSGLRLTLIYCTSGAVIGEMIAAQSGLGLLIQTYSGQFDIASVLAVMAVLVAIVVALSAALDALEGRLLGWAKGQSDVPGA